MEFYSALRKKEVFSFGQWMNLEGIILSEMSDRNK